MSRDRMELTAAVVKAKAKEFGADLVGIANGKVLDGPPPPPHHPHKPTRPTRSTRRRQA
jgi:hypothetical protein